MINSLIDRIRPYIAVVAAPLLLLLCSLPTYAFDTSVYAQNSVLSTGRWVKISVSTTGMHRISASSLRNMGFSDPSRVRVYGYGARRISDHLTAANYIDDLPMIPAIHTSSGIVFYAEGPTSWITVNKHLHRPAQNPFTTLGYYYLSDREAPSDEITITESGKPASAATGFHEALCHELDQFSAGETGHMLLGENFLYDKSQTFDFNLTDREPDTYIMMECSFMAKSATNTRINFTANGIKQTALSNDIAGSTTDKHGHYKEARISKYLVDNTGAEETELKGNTLSLNIAISNSGTMTMAALNYIAINYWRKLIVPKSGSLVFRSADELHIAGASASTRVWEVSNPTDIREIKGRLDGSTYIAADKGTGTHSYVVFDENASMPEPKVVGNVTNQDIHSLEVPDMVIFTIGAWRSQAERLAKMHAESPDSLKVLVVDQEQVFNEFASGSRDANSFRRLLKMFYDRSATSERKLRFALFMGRGTYDNRVITNAVKGLGYPTMPIWESDGGASDIDSYTTDDIFAFLQDGSGNNVGNDRYCISVGRLPVTSAETAREAVDKIIEYQTQMPHTGWRNRALIIADDDDNSVHMQQAETLIANMKSSDGGSDIDYQKLYTDEYPLAGGQYEQPREIMFRTLNEGIAWWFFIGHANATSWTGEKLLTYNDVNNMYLRQYPILYAACCDFLRWDAKDISAAEVMWRLKGGGAIAIISANRPSYISDNGRLSAALGQEIFNRRDDGSRPTVGEIYTNTKKRLLKNDTNKLRYVFLGDPAMYPIVPDNRVVITKINGVEVGNPDEDAVMMARQSATMEGYVSDPKGNIIEDFNGMINTTIYDAEQSVVTNGNGSSGEPFTFDRQGSRIYAGNDSIKAGRFTINVAMPSAISNNYRPAAASFYAHRENADNKQQAIGVNTDFYVYGEDETVVDDEAPRIVYAYLNHSNFANGDQVNTTPMLIAQITDNRGINISTAGIGHQMTIMLDERRSFSDVSEYYTPAADGSIGGTIAYPLPELTPGNHTIRLRVWDTSDNAETATLECFAVADLAPTLFDIYTDSNPASEKANFYLSHDRPDANMEITLSIYNMLGQPVWSTTVAGRSDTFQSFPITWDLTDMAGSRVARGIYLYRASIRMGDTESGTKTKRIAVTGM